VLLGNLPNSHGKLLPGSLQLIDRNGKLTQTITDKLDGPWDLTIADHTDSATVFVSNVLNGTVTRLNLTNLMASPNAVQVKAVVWSDEGFGYTIAPKADRNLLLRIAEIVYQQTSPDGAKAKIPPAPGKPS